MRYAEYLRGTKGLERMAKHAVQVALGAATGVVFVWLLGAQPDNSLEERAGYRVDQPIKESGSNEIQSLNLESLPSYREFQSAVSNYQIAADRLLRTAASVEPKDATVALADYVASLREARVSWEKLQARVEPDSRLSAMTMELDGKTGYQMRINLFDVLRSGHRDDVNAIRQGD